MPNPTCKAQGDDADKTLLRAPPGCKCRPATTGIQ
jgi:hypothetical protein